MKRKLSLYSNAPLEKRILTVRGEKVILDRDLAELYGVTTKALNQAIKRNPDRFPPDFAFFLDNAQKAEVVTNCDHLQMLKFSPNLPYVFTEHGAIMAASVLKSRRAVEMSLYVVRAFVRMREILAANADLARRLESLKRKYDGQFKSVFTAIEELLERTEPKRGQIGFGVKEGSARYRARRHRPPR
jgi:hypothetical protein